jgi:tRNA pseudouridine13 synthase
VPLPDWARACGAPLFKAAIRTTPADFDVTEMLGWEFTGDGEHDYLWLRKTSANTEWVARQLARHADVQRHNRKLRRGAHKSNTFRIVLRGDRVEQHAEALGARLALIREQGVPNYFGEQRFGHDGGNVELADAWAGGKRLPRHKRSIAISTIRSLLFNEQLDARVRAGTWNTLLPGDKANLDGTGSVFDVAEVDDELRARLEAMDIHPTGVLAGENSGLGPDAWQAALDKARVEEGWRSFRLVVQQLEWSAEPDAVTVSFSLGRGTFATSVLREICDT